MTDEPGNDKRINALPKKTEREQFNAIFKQYYPRLLAYAGIFVDEDTAKDIVQDLMVYFWDKSDTLTIHTSLESYFFKAVYQRCLNHLKHDKVKEGYLHAQLLEDIKAGYYDPDSNQVIREIFSTELRQILQDAIETLPPKCREAFTKSYIEGMPTTDIASELNISERTAETHIYNALKHLRVVLKDKVYVLLILGI